MQVLLGPAFPSQLVNEWLWATLAVCEGLLLSSHLEKDCGLSTERSWSSLVPACESELHTSIWPKTVCVCSCAHTGGIYTMERGDYTPQPFLPLPLLPFLKQSILHCGLWPLRCQTGFVRAGGGGGSNQKKLGSNKRFLSVQWPKLTWKSNVQHICVLLSLLTVSQHVTSLAVQSWTHKCALSQTLPKIHQLILDNLYVFKWSGFVAIFQWAQSLLLL